MVQQDKIGREEIVNKICALVDNLEKDKHFCLALNGEWGSGKSFVMQMIEDKLSTHKEYIILKYDAWKNNFYSDPLVAILSCILDGIEDKLYLIERRKEKFSKAAKTAAKALTILSTKAEKINNIIEELKGVIKYFHNPLDMSVVENFKSYQMLLNETKSILNEILQVERYRAKQSKLIILVDEIDRCLPDEQLKVLERLHHLFDVKNCAVIVAMNQKCIVNTIKTIYGVDGNEYLRKFFDFNYTLEMSSVTYLRNLLSDLKMILDKVNAKTDWSKPINTAFICLEYATIPIEKKDNREINRYYNAVNNLCNDFGWEKVETSNLFFILVALYIQRFISVEFLNLDNIKKKQEEKNESSFHITCYDYIQEYVTIEFDDIVGSIGFNVSYNSFLDYKEQFNSIVYLLTKESAQQENDSSICIKLRDLVLLYGGDKIDNKTVNS